MTKPIQATAPSGSTISAATNSPLRKTVILPTGKEVQASTGWEPWMDEDGATGWVVPEILAPDPDQPRDEMNEADLEELTESVRVAGVRQIIDITPVKRAPWIKVRKEHRNLPLLIVAGHRRQLAALGAPIGAVRIIIHIYADADEHDDDRSISNKQREGVTELDEGREMVKQITRRKLSVAELARRWGYSQPKAQARINLTQLDPAIWPLLKAVSGSRRSLAPTIGGHLGGVNTPTLDELEELRKQFTNDVAWSRSKESEKSIVPAADVSEIDDEDQLRFQWQRVMLAVIRHRGIPSSNAVNLILTHKATMSASHNATGRPSEKHQPKRRLDILDNTLEAFLKSEVWGWNGPEFTRICSNSSQQDVQAFVAKLTQVIAHAKGLGDILARISATKKATSPEVAELMKRRTG